MKINKQALSRKRANSFRDRRPDIREVYFIQGERLRLIKIGQAEDAQFRLTALRVMSPDRLNLLGVIICRRGGALERELHDRFSHLHSHGEWHEPGEDLLAYIAEHAGRYRDLVEAEVRKALQQTVESRA